MSDDSLLAQLTDEFIDEVKQGKLPDIETYAAKHPELADRIRELFPTLLLLEGMSSAGGPVQQGPSDPSGLSPGNMFGHYRIDREIGRGGMGIVYEASHLLLEKKVALKVLPIRPFMDATHLERFFREARTAAGLNHTNIVSVFDVGQVNGIPYYAMQYIEGRSLSTILHSMQSTVALKDPKGSSTDSTLDTDSETLTSPGGEPSSDKQKDRTNRFFADPSLRRRVGLPEKLDEYFRWVAGVGIQAAVGLAYAHERKVIHRDIKPSNLILDNKGVVWITDFGLARRIEDPALTQSGTLLGTPRYMSPEQAETAKRPVDHRSDIYSLGATLYELTTCRPVFEGKTPHDVISLIITKQPPTPRKLNERIPADLSTIVMKAMAKSPEDRYQSASQFAEDLNRWLKMKPIQARPIGPVGWTVRWCLRNPRLVAITAIAVAIILILSGVYNTVLMRKNANTRVLEQREQELRTQINPGRTLWWVDREGREEAIPLPPADYYFPNLSPDGTKVAMTVAVGGIRDIYIFDLVDGTSQRIPSEGIYNNQPLWSPNGRQIAYASGGSDGSLIKIVVQSVDIMDEPELVGSAMGDWIYPLSWSPDGKIILTSKPGPGMFNWDIGMISLEKDHPFTPLLDESSLELQPQLSPDGRWLAYSESEGPGGMKVFVSPFPDVKSGKWQVSVGGGNSPRWSPDGKEIYYLMGRQLAEWVIAIPVEPGPIFKTGTPKPLFQGNYLGSQPNNGIPYAVHPDGKRFLMIKGPVNSAVGK